MANKTINDLTSTDSAASGDFLPIWRASNGDTRKITKANFIGGVLTGAGTIATGGYTLTIPKTGTAAVGTGTAGRIAEWVTDANTLQASTLAKSGAGVLTLSAGSDYTLTVPKTGTAVVGTGTSGRVASFNGDANTLAASTLVKSGAGILTLDAASDYTLTVPATGTAALLGTAQTFSALQTFSAGISLGNETLTVYDDGTWSPAITGSGSNPTVAYSAQVGRYLRLGPIVYFYLAIAINTISGGSGDVRISLPIAVAAGYNPYVSLNVSGVDMPGTPISVAFRCVDGQSYGQPYSIQDNASVSALQVSGLANGDTIIATGFYFVA